MNSESFMTTWLTQAMAGARSAFIHSVRTTSGAAAAALMALAFAGAAHAQTGPVRILVGFPAGGGTDAIARTLADKLKDQLGVPVVVETPDGIPAKYQQAAAAGKGPDICTVAHDRIGEWVAGGLMHAIFNAPDSLHARWFRAAALCTARVARPALAACG